MELKIASAALSEVLQWVTRAVPARPTVPVLAGVRLQCVDDSLVVEASDLDWTLQSRTPADVRADGQVIIVGKLFAEVARALPSATAHCWSTEVEFVVECGGLEYRFSRLPEQEYPTVEPAPAALGEVDWPAFVNAVSCVGPAAGRDELIPVFTGVQVVVDDGRMTLAATDRYRMARTRVDWRARQVVATTTLLVPAKLLTEVCRAATAADVLEIGWASKSTDEPEHIGFRFTVGEESREVRARLLSGRFPSMTAVLEVATPLTLWVRTDELTLAVQRIRLTAEQRSSIYLSVIGGDRITVSSVSAGRASGKAVIDLPSMDGDGETTEIAFNPQYLLDALNTYTTEHLQMRINSGLRTAILHGATQDCQPTSDDHVHVVKMMNLQT